MLDYTSPRSSRACSSDLGYTELEVVKTEHGRLQSYSWHNGTGKNGELVSIFKISLKTKDYEIVTPYDVDLARHHLKHLKSVRHPFILKVLDSFESDSGIYVITERCYPFKNKYLSSDPTLGISNLISALNFLHKNCNLVYSMANPYGVAVKEDGSWCLHNFELVSEIEKGGNQLQNLLKNHISFNDGWRPNIANVNLNSVHFDKLVLTKYLSSWQLAAFICWVYALISGNEERCNIKRHGFDFNSFKLFVPRALHQLLNSLFSGEDVDLEHVLTNHEYFTQNTTFNTMTFISQLHIKSQFEIESFFAKLPENINKVPVLIRCKQLLPEILKSINLCKSILPMILDSVILICKSIVLQDFRKHVYPSILELFRDSDKSIRFCLLKRINELDELLDEEQVSKDMFEYFYVGFDDSSPQIRGETIKSLSYLIKKINAKQKTSCAYSLFKCVSDSEPTIRTNSIICFAKIIPFIDSELTSKILPQVWRTGLHDSFLKSKIASLEVFYTKYNFQSISASHNFISLQDKAHHLIPLVSETLLDSDPTVRKLSFETLSKLIESFKHCAYPGILHIQKPLETFKRSSSDHSW